LVLLSFISTGIGLLTAQQAQLSGPIEGFSFDAPTGSFRAVIGLPGSASFGPAILDGFSRGWVAPQKDYGLAFKDDKCMIVAGFGSEKASSFAVSAAISEPEGVVWSGDGSLAVLFSRAGNWIQALADIPNSGAPSVPVELSFLGGSLSAIAADARGKRVAIGTAGESGGVYLITDGGNPVPLLAGFQSIALAFSDDGSKLYALNGALSF